MATPELATRTAVFAGLMPHPPIVVPEVGAHDEQAGRCAATTRACAELARRLVAAGPAHVCLVSPHAPRRDRDLGLAGGPGLTGDLSPFGAPGARVDLPQDEDLARLLMGQLAAEGLGCWRFPGQALDHGALVPLLFLARAGWRGPTTLLSLPRRPGRTLLQSAGRALGHAVAACEERVALLSSGDLSHRVAPGGPAGFDSRAGAFDRAVVALAREGRLDRLASFDQELRQLAAEDVVDGTTLIVSALPDRPAHHAVLGYEHPFGVGYLVAVLHDRSVDDR